MKTHDIIWAWKDVHYRNSLSAEERASLPAHPAGSIELNEDELDAVIGGIEEDVGSRKIQTSGCCSKYKPGSGESDDGGDDSC